MTGAVTVCGDLSARRPGRATRKQPLPAERQRLGAISNYQPLTRVSRSAAQTAGRREPVTDRIRVRRGPAFGGIWKNVRTFRLLNPARNLILGLGRAFQPRKQSRSGLTDRFHLPSSLRDAPASEMQEITEGIPDERKPTARDGNLTARERKNAC